MIFAQHRLIVESIFYVRKLQKFYPELPLTEAKGEMKGAKICSTKIGGIQERHHEH